MNSSCAILFSGGTDSMCAAALVAEKFKEVHLITYYETGTESSASPTANVQKLQSFFPDTQFKHYVFSTDALVKKLSYENYFTNLMKFGFYNLATPGLSSLSWHLQTILFCKKHNISTVYDGMTQELLHLPGHMPEIRGLFTDLYKNFGISFSSPVINWEVPEDQRFMDRLIVDRHGFTETVKTSKKTTGQWLYDKKILPHPNIKGSEFDRLSQHDCYPFVVYNMLVFWLLEPLIGYEKFKSGLAIYIKSKIETSQIWVHSYLNNPSSCSFLSTRNENI